MTVLFVRTLHVSRALAISLLFTGLWAGGNRTLAQEAFLRGDVNVDGRVSTSDALMARRYLFLGGAIQCPNAVDVNDDGRANITDTVEILRFLFLDGEPPAAPYPEVGVDPTENDPQAFHIVCQSYQVVDPERTDDVVDLGDVSGAPGDAVEVPVFVNSSQAVEAFQLIIAYDPTSFTPIEAGFPGSPEETLSFDGTFYEGADLRIAFAAVKVDKDAGVFLVGFIPDLLFTDHELPAGTAKAAFRIRGKIPEDAPRGTVAQLTPTNGSDGMGYGLAHLKNELTHQGDVRLVSTEPRLQGALLEIVGDQIFFRGDANGDGEVNLSDARFSLNYLFSGGEPPNCLDAADSNDDGKVNISDPVAILLHLFAGGRPLPPPFSNRGVDPTHDELGCETITM